MQFNDDSAMTQGQFASIIPRNVLPLSNCDISPNSEMESDIADFRTHLLSSTTPIFDDQDDDHHLGDDIPCRPSSRLGFHSSTSLTDPTEAEDNDVLPMSLSSEVLRPICIPTLGHAPTVPPKQEPIRFSRCFVGNFASTPVPPSPTLSAHDTTTKSSDIAKLASDTSSPEKIGKELDMDITTASILSANNTHNQSLLASISPSPSTSSVSQKISSSRAYVQKWSFGSKSPSSSSSESTASMAPPATSLSGVPTHSSSTAGHDPELDCSTWSASAALVSRNTLGGNKSLIQHPVIPVVTPSPVPISFTTTTTTATPSTSVSSSVPTATTPITTTRMPAPAPTRRLYSCIPSPLASGVSSCGYYYGQNFHAYVNPPRHNYGHHGYSRYALLHMKWFWAMKEEEWEGHHLRMGITTLSDEMTTANFEGEGDQDIWAGEEGNSERGDDVLPSESSLSRLSVLRPAPLLQVSATEIATQASTLLRASSSEGAFEPRHELATEAVSSQGLPLPDIQVFNQTRAHPPAETLSLAQSETLHAHIQSPTEAQSHIHTRVIQLPPLTIHPRRGDLWALRDPYCMYVDRCFADMPLWTMAKTLWMYDVHIGADEFLRRKDNALPNDNTSSSSLFLEKHGQGGGDASIGDYEEVAIESEVEVEIEVESEGESQVSSGSDDSDLTLVDESELGNAGCSVSLPPVPVTVAMMDSGKRPRQECGGDGIVPRMFVCRMMRPHLSSREQKGVGEVVASECALRFRVPPKMRGGPPAVSLPPLPSSSPPSALLSPSTSPSSSARSKSMTSSQHASGSGSRVRNVTRHETGTQPSMAAWPRDWYRKWGLLIELLKREGINVRVGMKEDSRGERTVGMRKSPTLDVEMRLKTFEEDPDFDQVEDIGQSVEIIDDTGVEGDIPLVEEVRRDEDADVEIKMKMMTVAEIMEDDEIWGARRFEEGDDDEDDEEEEYDSDESADYEDEKRWADTFQLRRRQTGIQTTHVGGGGTGLGQPVVVL